MIKSRLRTMNNQLIHHQHKVHIGVCARETSDYGAFSSSHATFLRFLGLNPVLREFVDTSSGFRLPEGCSTLVLGSLTTSPVVSAGSTQVTGVQCNGIPLSVYDLSGFVGRGRRIVAAFGFTRDPVPSCKGEGSMEVEDCPVGAATESKLDPGIGEFCATAGMVDVLVVRPPTVMGQFQRRILDQKTYLSPDHSGSMHFDRLFKF